MEGEASTTLRYFCSPYHQDSALFPIIRQLERVAGFDCDDSAKRKLMKLDALLASVPTAPEEFRPIWCQRPHLLGDLRVWGGVAGQ